MNRYNVLAGLLIALVFVAVAGLVWEPLSARVVAAPPARAYDGRIVRDDFGVPHLFGPTDPDVVHALAYAHAEDDFGTLQEVMAMTRGRVGAITGQDGAKIDYVGHLFDVRGTVDAQFASVPADVRALLDAYAAGLNRYAARHPGEVKLARLFPVDARDIAAGFVLRSPFFFGIDDTLGALAGDKPLPPESAGTMARRTAGVAPSFSPLGNSEGMNGSNAFAIAPKRSADGRTRLLSNSHQQWNGNVAWYEVALHSGSGWEFAGATFPGGFVPFLGHNRQLGWTNTVNRPDLVDVYKLTLSDDGKQYRFDGQWRTLESRRVWLRVKLGPFTIPVPRTVHRSVHGPVIVNESGAYAMHFAGMGTMGMLEQYYRITKARDWGEWSGAMAKLQIPGTNFVYADRSGRVALIYNAMFPVRKPGFDYRRLLAGDTSRNLGEGTVPWAAIPKVIDPASGFIQNANNTPFLTAGLGSELSEAAVDPLLGVERDVTNRGRRATALLAADTSISEADLLRIKYDTTYARDGYAGRWLAEIAKLDTRDDAGLAAGQRLLATWDWTLDGRGRADALALLMMRPANRWNYKRLALPDVRAELTTATQHLTKHFGRLDPPLSAVLRIRRGSVDLPMNGGSDVLRAAALWDFDADGRARVRHGDSFIMLVDWDRAGRVTSRSIQPFGAATTRPQSQHFTDQAPLFAAKRLKPVHFERADLLRHAVRAYRP